MSSAGRLRVPPGRLRGLERRIGYGRQDLSRRRVPRLSAVSGQTVPCLLRQGVQRRCDRCLEQAEAAFAGVGNLGSHRIRDRSEEHTSELQSLMRISYAVFCLKKKKSNIKTFTNEYMFTIENYMKNT